MAAAAISPIATKFRMVTQFDTLDCADSHNVQILKIHDGSGRHSDKQIQQ